MTRHLDTNDLSETVWSATAVPAPKLDTVEGELEANTVIVGAGYTGLRSALILAESGQRVAVLDSKTIGWGASGRNAGHVNPLPPVHGPDAISRLVGSAYFDRLVEATLGSAEEVFAVIENYGIDCQLRRKGCLRLDHGRNAIHKSQAFAADWRRFGADIEFLDGPELHREVGSTEYQTGVLIRGGGAINPLSYARGLARCAMAAGALIYGNSPATALTREAGLWRVHTPTGLLMADTVLLCTNGYTDRLWPRLAQSVVPLSSIQVATDPLPSSIVESILPKGRTMIDTRRDVLYGLRDPDNRIVIGGVGRLSTGGDNAAYDRIRREAARIFPSLRGVDWKYQWGGRVAITRDRLPHLHELEPGLLAGLGYNGRGVAMATVMGRVLAERVLGKEVRELPFPITRIRTFPLHRYHVMGARLRMWWRRIQDRYEIAHG